MELKNKAFEHSYWGSKEKSFNQHTIKILSLVQTEFGLPITEKFKLLKQKSPSSPNLLLLHGGKMKLNHSPEAP